MTLHSRHPERLLEATVPAFGTPVRVTTPEDDQAARLFEEILAPWADGGEVPTIRAGYGAADTQTPTVTLHPLSRPALGRDAQHLSARVTAAALAHHRGRHLLFHAGGVARADGSVLAIVGPSGRGKTTTVRHLAQHFGYVSDETIAITLDGRVLPYRKPLSIHVEGQGYKQQIASSDLGLLPLPEAELRIAGLVLLERVPEAMPESRVERLPLTEGVVALVQHTSYLIEVADPLCRIARIAEATGGVRRLWAGSPDRVAEVAEELFEPDRVERWEQVVPGRVETNADQPWAPAPVVDAIECADATVVLSADRQVRLLTGVGPTVWRGLCEGEDRPSLEARVEASFGIPPEGTVREAIAAACTTLVRAGVLIRRG